MPKLSKRSQARHVASSDRSSAASTGSFRARPNAASLKAAKRQEPFADVAQRLGDALATVLEHDDCPAEVADIICELDTAIFNRFPDVAISLRYSLPHRLAGALREAGA